MRLNIGAHMSIAGGIDRAAERAREVGCESLQVFTRSNVQWRTRPLRPDEPETFRQLCREYDLRPVVGHACYLLNLASPDDALWQRSVESLIDEVGRAVRLRLPALVLHPGAHTGSGVEAGLRRVAEGLREMLRRTRGARVAILLETTAGAGSVVGGRFEDLAAVLAAVRSRRLGVCLDTAHVFAAGYDLRSAGAYERTMAEFDNVIGLERLRALHLNDTPARCGDRHARIGQGRLGRAAFRHVMRDARLRNLPKILETPKGERRGVSWDAISLRLLRRLAEE